MTTKLIKTPPKPTRKRVVNKAVNNLMFVTIGLLMLSVLLNLLILVSL